MSRLTTIGAILKKDLLTLWPITALAVALPLLRPWYGELGLLSAIVPPPLMIGLAGVLSIFLVFVVVQNDASVSTRHDWLTRPIRRIDMVLSKTIFLLAAILLPWLIANMASTMINAGFPFGEALLAVGGQIVLACLLLPILALAALTANKVEAIGAAIFVMVAVGAIGVLSERVLGSPAIEGPGRGWYLPLIALAFVAAVSLLALWLQYARRRTLAARSAVVAAFGVAGLTSLIPWSPASAAYRADAQPAVNIVGPSVCLVDKPLRPRGRIAPPLEQVGPTSPFQWRDAEKAAAGRGAKAVVANGFLSGLPAGWAVAIDRIDARYGDGAGAVTPFGGMTVTRFFGAGSVASTWLLPTDKAAIATRPDARLHLDTRMTVMKPVKTYRFPADGERHRVPGLGYCGTRNSRPGNSTMVDCLYVWPRPGLLTARFTDRPATCTVNCGEVEYTPTWAQLPFAVRFQPQIMGRRAGAEVVVTAYEPGERLRREVDIAGPAAACPSAPVAMASAEAAKPPITVTVKVGGAPK